MATKNIELRVGLFVIFALTIFVTTIVWIQGYRFSRDNYEITVLFEDVGSLAKGDPVMVSGIRKGKVRDLKLAAEGVEVLLVLSNDVVLKRDARITVKNIGLMGERFVAIKQGKSSESLDIKVIFPGNYDTGIPEVMGMMGEMISELRNLVLSLRRSVASEENLEKLSATIGHFEQLSKSLSDYMSRHENKFDRVAENFLAASKSLNEIISSSAGRVDTTLERVGKLTLSMQGIVADLEQVARTAREFAENLNSGDGTLQMLVDDRRLYDDLRKTADNLDDLITDIRENPRKYIQLKVELF